MLRGRTGDGLISCNVTLGLQSKGEEISISRNRESGWGHKPAARQRDGASRDYPVRPGEAEWLRYL